jgi:hypothetical protein
LTLASGKKRTRAMRKMPVEDKEDLPEAEVAAGETWKR